MGQLSVVISSRRNDATLKKMFESPGQSAKQSISQNLVNYVTSVFTGTELGPVGGPPSFAISVLGQAAAASGTFTVSSTGSANGQVGSIAGVSFTAVTSGATGNQFNISATPATQAQNMVTAFNASPQLAGIATASRVGAVVTITSAVKGTIGNAIAISAGNWANVAASGALLTGGAADPTAITLNF